MNFQLINTEETISRLISLIRDARERVTLISPYITLMAEDRLGRAIREALGRKVKVNIVIRQDDQTPLKEAWLGAMRPHVEAGLQLFGVQGLHAKLYRSESTVLITSLNLLGSSFLNTIEIGLWSQESQALRDVDTFIKREVVPHARPVSLDAPARLGSVSGSRRPRAATNSSSPLKKTPRPDSGCCIRCGENIRLDPDRPYCKGCFAEWAEWENEDYEDEYCHACGDDYPASMAQPLCDECYQHFA